MAENEGSTSSENVRRPQITLPPRSGMENLFTGAAGVSPGPMTLVSSFFSENDPDGDCRSFSQLLAGAMSPEAVAGYKPGFPAALAAEDSSEDVESTGGGGGTDVDFRFRMNRPSGLMVTQPQMFTIPPGLSPASLLDSPGFFSAGQGALGMSHQQALAQVTAQAAQSHNQSYIQVDYPSLSAASFPQQRLSSVPDRNLLKESSDLSHSDQRSQPSSFTIDKPADDGYNWRKYGQKQVKGSEYPRSYYKCTHPSCPVKKKVERSFDGQVTEIIYKGQHNHQPPESSKRGNETSNLKGNSELGLKGQTGSLNKLNDGGPASILSMKDQESSLALSGSSDSEEADDAETRIGERNEDEREAKRRNTEVRVLEPVSSHQTVTEPRIVVQTTSEVDLLDDGFKWRKYGQKVVKGNPYPRSYYKCTSPGCNVRKHVERAASDPKAVITTYEGKHNHDVPTAKQSSHNTSNGAGAGLRPKPQNVVADKHALVRRMGFPNNDQRQIGLLRFKEEQIT